MTGAAAPITPSGENQISSVVAEMNAPAEMASLFTKVSVFPGNFPIASMISNVESSAPPGVFMSSITRSALSSIACFRPRRMMNNIGESICSLTGITTTRVGWPGADESPAAGAAKTPPAVVRTASRARTQDLT